MEEEVFSMEWIANLRNSALLITALFAAGSSIFGIHSYLDTTYASVAEVEKLKKRLTLTELRDLLKEGLNNLYFYRSQVRKYTDDQELQDKLNEAEDDVKDLKDQIKELRKSN